MVVDYNFINVGSWFDKRYRVDSGLRYLTFKTALNLFMQNDGKLVVETGTVRGENDWGAGMSTVMFGDFAKRHGAKFITIDNNEKNIEISKQITKEWADSIEYVVKDSVEFLGKFKGQIDLLYLDSVDYPFGEVVSRYSDEKDLGKAIEIVRKIPEEAVTKEIKDIVTPCQEFQLKELELSWKNLRKGSVVLLDDNDFPGGGKTRLAKEYLRDRGAVCLMDAYQSLWTI